MGGTMKNNETLKIFFSYSGRDKEGRNPVKEAIDYLTEPGADNQIYAEAVPHPWSPKTGHDKTLWEKLRTTFLKSQLVKWIVLLFEWSLGLWFIREMRKRLKLRDWKNEAEKYIEESDVLVFLYSENSRDESDAENIKWELETAKRLDRNVILCSLDRSEEDNPPAWVKKVDETARNFTQQELRDRIERHDFKRYDYSSLNLKDLADKPNSTTADRMFEQYKMYKEEADKLIDRRQTVSNYYLLMNGALLTLIGVILDPNQKLPGVALVLFLSSAVGIVISRLWLDMVNYYKNLNTAKQRLINAMEEYLPLQLNATEYYEIMKDPLNRGRYKSFGEATIPNTIHASWGGLFLCSAGILLVLLIQKISLYRWGVPLLCVLFALLLSEPFIESILRSRRRARKGAKR